MSQKRVKLSDAAPQMYKTLIQLDGQCTQVVADAGIDKGFSHLLRLRVSQINGCSFCVRKHSLEALKEGQSAERVALVSAWLECDYFNQQERAMFELVEAVTHIYQTAAYEKVYESVSQTLDEAMLGAVQWLAVMYNIWNRVAILSSYPVAPGK